MPDPLIASAFVKIKPEPKSVSGFGKEVRTKIEKSFERPVRIKVQPTLLPFKAKIQKELSTATFTIKVTPVLAPGFKGQVAKLVREAGVSVPVRAETLRAITPAGRLPGAAANVITQRNKPAAAPARTSAAAREEAFLKKLKALTVDQTIATKALTKAEQAEGSVKERKRVISAAVSKSETALNKAITQQIALEGTLTQKQAARLATAVKRAEGSLAAARGLQTELEAEVALTAARKQADAQAAISADLDVKRIALKAELAAADQAGALSTTRVSAARAVLTATTNALGAAEALHREAMATEDVALQRLTAALVRRAVADEAAARGAVRTAIADERAAKAAQLRATREAQLQRGLLATALAALGARGATLAAGSEFLAGAAIATGLFKSVQLAARLETELNVFRVTAGATAEQIAAVSDKAKELGADLTLPAVSANTAASAMTELAKAGLTVEDAMDAAKGTLQLATAAQLDNATAVNITASALNAFGLEGNKAVHVADLLAGASNEAQGGIGDMGGALSSVASVARQAGLSIEDTVAFLTLLAKNGIQGAEAGTALRVALLRLIAPTKAARDELEGLGVSVLDQFGQIRPDVFSDIAQASNELTASQRNLALQTIFGTRAIRAQAVLGREGSVGLNAMREATNKSGLAAELAGARTQGFAGKVEALKNTAATAGLNVGQILIPPLDLLIQSVNQNVIAVDKLITALRKLATLDFDFPGRDKAAGAAGSIFGVGGEVGRGLDKLTAGIPVVNAFFDPISGMSEEAKRNLDDLNESIAAVTGNFVPLATQIQRAFRTEGGEQGAVKFIRDLEEKITETTPHAEELRSFLEGIVRTLTALGRAPTDIELKALFDKGFIPDELAKVQGLIYASRPLVIPVGAPKDIKATLVDESTQAAEAAAKASQERFSMMFGSELAADPIGRAIWDPFFLQSVTAAEEAAKKSAQAFSSSFQDQLDLNQARGGGARGELALAQQQLPGARRRFERAQAAFERAPTEAHKKFRDFALGRLNEILDTIASATSDIESKQKAATDKLAEARNKADQAFLDALGLQRGNIENAILRAEGRAGLENDIKTHTMLRDFLKRKIAEASKTIKDAQTKAETIQSLTADLITENQKLKELNQQLVASIGEQFEARISIAQITGTVEQIRKFFAAWIDALQKALADATKGSKIARDLKLAILQTQQSAFDAINEGFELDIQIAQAQERPRAEIRARERFIEQLKRERAQHKEGTLEYKRLTLEIVQQQKAIEELRGAQSDRNKALIALQKQEFAFLQTIQGFSANLISNLIPGGFTGGLLGGGGGGSSTVGSGTDISQASAASPFFDLADPRRTPGKTPKDAIAGASGTTPRLFTSGQGNTTNELLKKILAELHKMNRSREHPEAKHQRKTGSAAMDYGSGGGGGGHSPLAL